jgi:hypothetical protein
MDITYDLICGISLGFEYVEEDLEEDIPRTLIVDLFIVRFLFQW